MPSWRMLSTLSTESDACDSDGSYTVCVHGLGHGHGSVSSESEGAGQEVFRAARLSQDSMGGNNQSQCTACL